jgi:DNA-binding protein YbaB
LLVSHRLLPLEYAQEPGKPVSDARRWRVVAVEPSGQHRPDWAALGGMVDDLTRALRNAEEAQRRVFEVTATAWSDDRLVKAVVGPRGQLIDLDIDPRIYRRPNSRALAATIVATVRAATDQAMAKTQQILDGQLPADIRLGKIGSIDLQRLVRTHDADLGKENDDDQ